MGIGVSVALGRDGDRNQAAPDAGGPEGLDNGSAYSAGIDYQGLVCIGQVAGPGDQVADAADDFKIVSPEGEGLDVAKDKAEFEIEFEADGIAVTGGVVTAFEDGDRGRILATSDVETKEDVWMK